MALSRATTLDGLHLLDFRVGVVRAHEKVKAFYAGLEVCSCYGYLIGDWWIVFLPVPC